MKMKDGVLTDPDLHPTMNFIWLIKHIHDDEIYKDYIEETLNEIGETCVQGITHRLMMLYCLIE
jgi:hypothetical protein